MHITGIAGWILPEYVEYNQNLEGLIRILVDIASKKPKTYPITSAILSKLLSLIEKPETQERILKAILARFDKIPNTGQIKIWLQRITLKIDRTKKIPIKPCFVPNIY